MATKYADWTLGDDANAGTQLLPWKHIPGDTGDATGYTPSAGDFLLRKCGETWRVQNTVPSSGSAGNVITFGAYGSGADPILDGSVSVTGWSVYSSEDTENFTDGTGDKPLSWWMLTEASGNRADGNTTNNNTLAESGGTIDRVTGPNTNVPYGATFVAASNQKLTRANNDQSAGFPGKDGVADVSISFGGWFRPTSFSANRGLIGHTDSFNINIGSDAQIAFRIQDDSFATHDAYGGSGAALATLDAWVHLVGTWNQSTGAMLLYKNGSAIGAGATSATMLQWSNPFNLGYGRSDYAYFQGDIAEAFVFTSVLTADQVADIYNGGLAGKTLSVWSAAESTAAPEMVLFDDVLGTKVASAAACTSARKWYWASNVLYTYGTGDPLETYTQIDATVLPGSPDGLVHFNGKSYVTIDGITVQKSNKYGIAYYASGAGQAGHTVQNCTVRFCVDGGIVFDSDTNMHDDVLIDNCIVNNVNTKQPFGSAVSEGITVRRADGFEIKNCTVTAFYEDGIDAKLGATNGTIHHNTVVGGSQYSSRPGIYIDGASNVDIYCNRVHGCRFGASPYSQGVFINSENVSFAVDNIKVYYNLIYDNDVGLEHQTLGGAAVSNIKVWNNVFYNNNWQLTWNANLTGKLSGTNEVKNNIFDTNSVIVISDATTGNEAIGLTTIDHNFFVTGANTETVGTNAVQAASALFVNAAGGDFHLQAGSPCRDAGVDVGLTTDYDGMPVPFGAAPDMGAFEYGAIALLSQVRNRVVVTRGLRVS
jgi:hypothetical protein